ncbi:MAG: hypothetical protein M5R40_26350 [Anaerolineae bacterium]|nr:hypothetical protein [Anaerolineae bacterium]
MARPDDLAGGANIYVYADQQLRIAYREADLLTPGEIVLQAGGASPDAPLRIDDLRVTHPLPASSHFETAMWPQSWERDAAGQAEVAQQAEGGYLEASKTELAPLTGALDDFMMACRYWPRAGGFRLYAREGR